jgi:hypothetical protein
MSTPLPQVPPVNASPVCRMLRTKTAFGMMSPEEDWTEGESTTAVYWCLGTMETAGPDNLLCHPDTCRAGRACYQAELE